jgi:ubiquinone/menaquinone biosynthesis C-methylase UbiE
MLRRPLTQEDWEMAFAELKARQAVIWGDGPYERITNTLRDMHTLVVDRIDPQPGEAVLDAATGTGAVAILAAKRGADVVGLDLSPVLIETARTRADEEGVEVTFEVGDTEAMAYEDARFNASVSSVGVVFAPDHAAVANELARVTRPGGRIALTAWTPESEMLRMMGPFLPTPPPGIGDPFDWGRADYAESLLGGAFDLQFEEHVSPLVVESGEASWELFTTSYGPTKGVVRALDDERREEFHRSWVDFFEAYREDGVVVYPRPYLLTLGTRH